MKFNNVTYLVKEGARNVLANKLMSFASIGVLIACLLLIGGATLFSLNVNSVVHYVEQRNQVIAFLHEDADEQDAHVMQLTLGGMENILDVTFVSKSEALELQKARVGDEYANLFEGLDEDNPLLPYFVLRIEDTALLEDTVAALQETDGITRVNAATEVAQIVTGVKNAVTMTGSVVVVILIAVSVVIITNTIKLTVFSRRKEINIMKYVGATDSFIRLPFLVEGMLIGLLAASVAFLLLGSGYTYLLGWIEEHYASTVLSVINRNAIDFWEIAHYIFGGFAALGIFIGVVGSSVFVRKYLKV